jgi:hypothetical protein
MLTRIKIALVAALIASTASAALARTTYIPQSQFQQFQDGQYTDEGQGRFNPVDGGAP